MDKEQAIHDFWSSFELPAYDENSVPDDAQYPYITYNVTSDTFDNKAVLSGSLWYNTTTWRDITMLEHKISSYISYGGKVVKIDNGYLWIKRGDPFAQRMGDENKNLKRIVINLAVDFFTVN